MRLTLGADANATAADSATGVYYVLKLVTEVQNEVEVLKSVLNELEVVRLCCALGMLSSTNEHEFATDMLEASDFDDDFVRFLRKEVFGPDVHDGKKLRVMSLFGRQVAVQAELTRLGLWSEALEKTLSINGTLSKQGIYLLTLSSSSTEKTLVAFGWIDDKLFEPERIRDIATYVVRFLTCLSPDTICCLTTKDVAKLDEEVAQLQSYDQDTAWQSFSVSFRVEKQEDQKDAVLCEQIGREYRLPLVENAKLWQMVSGSYPAFAVSKVAPRFKRINKTARDFPNPEAFASWIKSIADDNRVKLPQLKNTDLRDALLRVFDKWPAEALDRLRDERERSLVDVDGQGQEQATMYTEECRQHLMETTTHLFTCDVLNANDEVKASHEALSSHLDALYRDRNISSQVDQQVKRIITLPLRLVQFMDKIHDAFETKDDVKLNEMINTIIVSDERQLQDKFRSCGLSAILRRVFLSGEREISDAFRERMIEPLANMKQMWLQAVNDMLETIWKVKTKELADSNRCAIETTCDKDRKKALDDELTNLRSSLATSDSELEVTIRNVKWIRFRVWFSVEEEYWSPPSECVEVFKMGPKFHDPDQLRSLGMFTLAKDEQVLGIYSVRTHSVVVVSALDTSTSVQVVEFPVSAWKSGDSLYVNKIRQFPRRARMCSFDIKTRLLALLDSNDEITIFKFSDNFRGLEKIQSINALSKTTLTSPLQDLLLVENVVYCVDTRGHAQSINLLSRQMSKKFEVPRWKTTHEEDEEAPSPGSRLFTVSDGLVLGTLNMVSTGGKHFHRNSYHASVCAFSTEDNRCLPVTSGVMESLQSRHALSIASFQDHLMLLDPEARTLQTLRLSVTVRSDSYRIRHSTGMRGSGNQSSSVASDTKQSTMVNHVLSAFYHLYEKFPVDGMLEKQFASPALQLTVVCDDGMMQSPKATLETNVRTLVNHLMTSLKQLNKPLGNLDLMQALTVETRPGTSSQKSLLSTHTGRCTPRPLRTLVQTLITFVPVQICRAENNTLQILIDGEDRSQDMLMQHSMRLQAVDIARSIRFGLLTPLLEAWRGRSVVITSMGKQSTGKSYFLNHLTGSSFAISGARCTDGAWMTVRILKSGVLVVILDFEGLGSFERSEQEDVFLSVLNAAISMFTIFRIEMRFDKEIDDLFVRFQKGTQLIKSDPQLFRGSLYMSVKDVNPNDQCNLLQEFIAKFQNVLQANRDQNFLSDMYGGKLDINSSPPLGTSGYYQSLRVAQQFIYERLCAQSDVGFPNGKAFLDCVRLILAKISILDWTSLDESAQKMKMSEFIECLPGVVRCGSVIAREFVQKDCVPEDSKECLVAAVDGAPIEINLDEMIAEYPEFASKWTELNEKISMAEIPDSVVDFGAGLTRIGNHPSEVVEANKAINSLFQLFQMVMTPDDDAMPALKITKQLMVDFDVFLSLLVRRRKMVCAKWAADFLGGKPTEERNAIEKQQTTRLQMLLTRCTHQCKNCQLGCMLSAAHSMEIDHSCGTSHNCRGRCDFCGENEKFAFKTPPCDKPAGHDGLCECVDGDHTCGKQCALNKAVNCGHECALKIGHEGAHKCSVQLHCCGEPCLAKNCSGRCQLSIEFPHTAHKCAEVRCMERCLMDGCQEVCGVLDHFHGQTEVQVTHTVEQSIHSKDHEMFDASSEVPVIHMCNKDHWCQAMCAEDGICHREVNIRAKSKTFKGKRGEFQYTYQEMNGSRKKCAMKLDPGQQTHQGNHSCIVEGNTRRRGDDDDDQLLHYCDARCPCCSYYCNKSFGHDGMHSTTHGNMRNTFFMSDEQDIDVDDRKYKTGERGVAEMCNLYCSKMGRAHVHYLECEQKSKKKCVYAGDSTDQRRHCTRELKPTPEHAMDELLHDRFWKRLGWEDPCASAHERELFGKCAYQCDAPDHKDKPSHCVLDAWHTPVKQPSSGHDGFSYVIGHKFECVHTANSGKLHHVFVLDCSGSMQGWPWERLMAAVEEYVQNRVREGATLDLVSVVTFDSFGQIDVEAQNITTAAHRNARYRGGGTTYAEGLRYASAVLSRIKLDVFKPVVVFFSDGQPHDPQQGEIVASHIADTYGKYGLEAFAVGFGEINLNVLQRIAEKLGGSYYHALTGNELSQTFHTISASLSTRAGLALSKQPQHDLLCVICQKELVAEDTIALQPCKHELHRSCFRQLEQQAAQQQEEEDNNDQDHASCLLCPVCRKPVV